MNLLNRIKTKIHKFAEAYFTSYPTIDAQVDSDDRLYRKLSGNSWKDISPLTQDRMLAIAYYLYETNPLAHRIIELTKDFIVGEGIGFSAADPAVQEVLRDFWDDPVNQWDLKQHQKALELGLYGEQCYPVFVNDISGQVRLGYIDPAQINEVMADPDNCEVIREVETKTTGYGLQASSKDTTTLRVIGVDEDPKSPTYGYLAGACFFFKVNSVSNATRGRSDLLPLLDWISAYDELLFNRLDRAALINAFVWDITLKGMTQEEINKWLKDNPPPKPGSIRAHNENVTFNAVTPDLKAGDAEHDSRLIKNYILAGAGFPEHWFADGGNTNLATAGEMSEPTIKRLTARQRYFRHMIEYIFEFVIDQAILHKRLPPDVNRSFQLIVPDMAIKDVSKAMAAMSQATSAVVTAAQQGWISQKTAARIFAVFSAQLGVEIDVDQEVQGE